MAELKLELQRLEADDARPTFASGDDDLDEFFHQDSKEGCLELLCVTYAMYFGDKAVAFFSLSNDSIKKEDVPRSAFERALSAVPRAKRYKSMPAAKIGRLGVTAECQREGYGTQVLDYLKLWFTSNNKTGCRFLVVDAYNRTNVTSFYEKNDFRFLTGVDDEDSTRIMYFDLKRFIRT